MEEEVELEISINIGSQRLELQVPRGADLSALIPRFLALHALSPRYHPHILQLVTQQLAQRPPTPAHSNSEAASTAQQEEREERATAGVGQGAVNNSKGIVLSKIQREIEAREKENVPESRKVYEQWKQREKEKRERGERGERPADPPRAATHREKVEPDFFYRKGLQFQSDCARSNEQAFQQLYPFRTHDRPLTPAAQRALCDRLSREKSPPVRQLLGARGEAGEAGEGGREDAVKERVRQEDEKIDRLIYHMIRERPVSPRPHTPARSPFRKTLIH